MHIFRAKANSNENFQWLNLKVVVFMLNNSASLSLLVRQFITSCLTLSYRCKYFLLHNTLLIIINNYRQLLITLQSYGMPHGLGMGGDLEKFRLFLPDSLEGCSACNNCLTFETGSFFHDYRKAAPPPPAAASSSSSSSFDPHGSSTPVPGLGPDFDIGEMNSKTYIHTYIHSILSMMCFNAVICVVLC